jgi:transcriptional regulator with XRE-family HTH domain
MNISDRIQSLRKIKGISQEELADRIGVSRQAVSKWESEQSTPDLDKIILLSDYFSVTTDYLLKGIEPAAPAEKESNAGICVIVSTVLNFIGLIVSAAIWYELQTAGAIVIGLVFMALGCMVFGIGMQGAAGSAKKTAQYNFWSVNIWLLTFLPFSFVYNIIFCGLAAPYPVYIFPFIWFVPFWAVYVALGTYVEYRLYKARKAG